MQKYEAVTTAKSIPNPIDISRGQAFNIALANLIIASVTAFLLHVLLLWFFGVSLAMVLFSIAGLYAFYEFGVHLKRYTEEDRARMYSIMQTYIEEEDSETVDLNDKLHIPTGEGNSQYRLDVTVNNSQLIAIAKTALQKQALPVNYLESLGMSRQTAEKLRIELEQAGLAKGKRCEITNAGLKSFRALLDRIL